MRRFAETCERVVATSKKTEKVREVAGYLRSLPVEGAATAGIFLTGRAFPRWEERTLSAGGALIWQAVGKLSGESPESLEAIYRKHGDLGGMAEEALRRRTPAGVSLDEAVLAFQEIAGRRGPAAKLALLEELLARARPVEAKYLLKIMTGDLRIGLKESLVEEAIAAAYGQSPNEVRRANMFTGDIAATLRLAAAGRLHEARLRLFHPIGFMLATPAEDSAAIAREFPDGFLAEDKYDGIRAQAHKQGRSVKLFSRTLDEIVEFHELHAPLAALPGDFVMDGEVVGWREGRALPFTELQQRLGLKQPDLWLPLEIPVCFMAFDLLFQDGDQLFDTPLIERRRRLEALLAGAETQYLRASPARRLTSAEEAQAAWEAALARGNEGIMAKAPDSPYTPGRRGRHWLKWKQPMATLDAVVTAVEYGHGKRRGLLSDYTFAVRDGTRLVNIGKAYSGLTDVEIHRLTEHFLSCTLEDEGFRRVVEPNVVLEVAFNNIQRSDRHASGYALRFPRIVRLRQDKPVAEIDTLERVRELYESQARST